MSQMNDRLPSIADSAVRNSGILLHRKDRALAETAALLVLSKKLSAIFHDGEDA
jgi:hypothetical protein